MSKAEALDFIRSYAEKNYTYTGDQVLEAYREAGGPMEDAGRGNRINWGNLMNDAEAAGVHIVIGRVKPRTKHCHVASTCLRKSLVFKGEAPADIDIPKQVINGLWSAACVERDITVKDALWMAYTYGVENAS